MGIASDLIYIVVVALIGGVVAHSIRQPLLLGYILAGVIVGPHTAGPTVERIHEIEMLAEVGVALLLFTLGLEFSFGELRRLAKLTFIGTPIQIVLSLLVTYLVAILLGFSSTDALWMGGTISLSSTMVVLKTLAARDALDTGPGRLMLAILIAQDLAVIPLLLILPQLSSDVINFELIAWAVLKSVLFLVGMYYAGIHLFPQLFSKISRLKSRELFFLATLAVALGAGYLSYKMGLSFALGAFIAGMLLSETDFNHQALTDVANLRDLFGLIFFVSVGMLLDPQFVIENLGRIALFAAIVILSKALILGGIIRVFGHGRHAAASVGLGLSQVGEFAFVVANAGSRAGQLSHDSYSLMIAVTVASMVATPTLLSIGNRVIPPTADPLPPGGLDYRGEELKNHVIIIGGGVVGRYVARVLLSLEVPLLIVESDYKSVTEIRDLELPVLFGDATHRTILESASLDKAKLVIISITNDNLLPSLLKEIRQISQEVAVVVRVEEVDAMQKLGMYNLQERVQPQLEVGLEMVAQALMTLGSRDAEIFSIIAQLRGEGYRTDSSPNLTDKRRLHATRLLEFVWIEVDRRWMGRSLKELALRVKHSVYIAAVIRGEQFTPNPRSEFVVQEGDIIGVIGSQGEVNTFQLYVQSNREGVAQE